MRRHLAPVALLVATLLAGCGGPDERADAAPETAPEPVGGLLATIGTNRLYALDRAFGLGVQNVGTGPVVVREVQLDSNLFTTAPAAAREVVLAPGGRRLVLPLPYGEARCDATEPTFAAVLVLDDGEELRVPAAEEYPGAVGRLHGRECAAADVHERVDIHFGDRWTRDGVAITGELLVDQRHPGARVRRRTDDPGAGHHQRRPVRSARAGGGQAAVRVPQLGDRRRRGVGPGGAGADGRRPGRARGAVRHLLSGLYPRAGMGVDPSVIAALRAACEADPENQPLRLHLAATLLDGGDAQGALDAAREVLAAAPDAAAALDLAARAADAVGNPKVAESYRRLLGVVGESPPAVPAQDLAPDDEYDQFLREVLADESLTRVTLDDVGGLDDVKRRLRTSFLAPLANPELRSMYGASLRGGLLLYGPPGCGKTFLARAIAGELGARFVSIGLHDVLDMWLGQSERNLHGIFEHARALAPAVLFFDEVDALGMKRANLTHSAGRNVVAQLLTELDSLGSANEGLYVLGATNAPWDVDAALRRPGRFDRTMLVLPPDLDARAAIVGLHLRDKPVGRVDVADIAKRTDGWSGADLRLLCTAAAEHAMEDSIARGTARAIEQGDLRAALRDVKPSVRAWFETARNYAAFANQSGEYDDLLAYMRAKRLA